MTLALTIIALWFIASAFAVAAWVRAMTGIYECDQRPRDGEPGGLSENTPVQPWKE
jgi:hypothetical protein